MSWDNFFNSIKTKDYYQELMKFIDKEYSENVCYPPKELIFNAFRLVDSNDIKVIIIGQDPYIHKGEAMGLAFSVNEGIKLPPSLRNIYKEIENEFNMPMDYGSGDLTYLAKQGVFLINPILTVREGKSLSHNNALYQELFKDLFEYIDAFLTQPLVIMLWGNKAKEYKKYITNKNKNILILESSHPSPLSANQGGWFNSGIFIKTNEYLEKNNIKKISWTNSIFHLD